MWYIVLKASFIMTYEKYIVLEISEKYRIYREKCGVIRTNKKYSFFRKLFFLLTFWHWYQYFFNYQKVRVLKNMNPFKNIIIDVHFLIFHALCTKLLICIVFTNKTLHRHKVYWNSDTCLLEAKQNIKNISLETKKRLLNCYLISILRYGSECWIILVKTKKRLEAIITWVCRRILRMAWTERVNNQGKRKRKGQL